MHIKISNAQYSTKPFNLNYLSLRNIQNKKKGEQTFSFYVIVWWRTNKNITKFHIKENLNHRFKNGEREKQRERARKSKQRWNQPWREALNSYVNSAPTSLEMPLSWPENVLILGVLAHVRQIGQMGVFNSHESMHWEWKKCLQFGNNLHLSPFLKFSKQTAQSTGLLLAFSSATALYSKQGSFFSSSWDIPRPPLPPLWTIAPFPYALLKALPTIHTWITIKTAIPTNNNTKDTTISMTIVCADKTQKQFSEKYPDFLACQTPQNQITELSSFSSNTNKPRSWNGCAGNSNAWTLQIIDFTKTQLLQLSSAFKKKAETEESLGKKTVLRWILGGLCMRSLVGGVNRNRSYGMPALSFSIIKLLKASIMPA